FSLPPLPTALDFNRRESLLANACRHCDLQARRPCRRRPPRHAGHRPSRRRSHLPRPPPSLASLPRDGNRRSPRPLGHPLDRRFRAPSRRRSREPVGRDGPRPPRDRARLRPAPPDAAPPAPRLHRGDGPGMAARFAGALPLRRQRRARAAHRAPGIAGPRVRAPGSHVEARPRRLRCPRDRAARSDPRGQDAPDTRPPGARSPPSRRPGNRLRLHRPSRQTPPRPALPHRPAPPPAPLRALLGPDRIGPPRRVDAPRPERFTTTGYAPPPPPTIPRPSKTGRGLLAVRVLRPPLELEVLVTPHTSSGAI